MNDRFNDDFASVFVEEENLRGLEQQQQDDMREIEERSSRALQAFARYVPSVVSEEDFSALCYLAGQKPVRT